MAKMSGRGLGHTGGTVDKLESIPGYQTTLSADAFMQQVEDVGVAVIGQSGNLTPADKKLYALRDVTATIDSLPLITSSIMSKKLAAGAHSIVLDVKIGSGAFMKTLEDGQKLAESMVRIGKACGRNVVAVMSNMDIPLGFYIGNALEVREAVEVLRGHGCPDLTGVCITLAANMLHLCNGWPIEEATKQAEEAISSGRAFEQMKRWIAAQGGDARVLDDVSLLPQAAVRYELKAPQAGYIHHMDAQKIGESSAILGAGRKTKDDTIDFAAGIVLKEKTGAKVEQGQTLAVLHTNRLKDCRCRRGKRGLKPSVGTDAPQPPIYFGSKPGQIHPHRLQMLPKSSVFSRFPASAWNTSVHQRMHSLKRRRSNRHDHELLHIQSGRKCMTPAI